MQGWGLGQDAGGLLFSHPDFTMRAGFFKESKAMSSQNDGLDSGQSAAMIVVFSAVALVVAAAIGAGIYSQSKNLAVATLTAVPATLAPTNVASAANVPSVSSAANSAQTASDAASVKVENGVVKFYFASGKSDLATGANAAMVDVVKGAQAGRKLVISGYHDATGSATKNAELAKLRAFAVRDALKSAGVADSKIELKKPEALQVEGSNAEARRVEVALQ